jgi:predicted nucleotidyltransferase
MGVERVYLFGSHARGTATRRSDLDLLIFWETDLPPLERIGQVLWALRDLPFPVEAVVLTPQEFENRRELPFLRGVLKEAKLIYERGKTAA